jgi:hypothetical protein
MPLFLHTKDSDDFEPQWADRSFDKDQAGAADYRKQRTTSITTGFDHIDLDQGAP